MCGIHFLTKGFKVAGFQCLAGLEQPLLFFYNILAALVHDGRKCGPVLFKKGRLHIS